uniref:Ganglioside induced differentiation associated protein 2 n=1 Tax=Pavo cristatus TaxID=9049 RepID=A0A8C9F9D2_PAVCR
MDPLGAPSQFVDVDSLPSWSNACEATQVDSHQNPVEKAQVNVRSPFPYREDLNAKIVLWKGDVALLNCTAIVNTSNESLTDKNPVSESIFMHAGPDLKDELQKLKGCRTGEAKLTKGFNLAARFIIHTVGPKYKSRYRTAAESSLYSCYRNVLQLANKVSFGFENLMNSTVRRFLEIHGETLEKVVFAVSELEETFNHWLATYEMFGLAYMGADVCSGILWPFPIVSIACHTRAMKLSSYPNYASDEEGLEADLSFIGSHAFARMEGDVDKQRRLILQGQLSEAALQKQHQRKNLTWLGDVSSCYFFLVGVDNCGRTVMVVVGRNIPVTLIDMEKVRLCKTKANFIMRSYKVVSLKTSLSLKFLFGVYLQVSTWFFTTFTVSGLKDKIHYVESLQQLFTAIPPEQIDLPPFVLEYDARENGPYYSSYPPSPDL